MHEPKPAAALVPNSRKTRGANGRRLRHALATALLAITPILSAFDAQAEHGFRAALASAGPADDYCTGFENPPTPDLPYEPFIAHPTPGSPHFLPGAIADYDNDGDPDLPHLQNQGNLNFTLQPAIDDLIAEADYGGGANLNFHGVAAIDYDEDGWQDFVLAPYYFAVEGIPIMLFHNLGNWEFELSQQAYFESLLGFDETSRWFSETIIVGDLTGDGHNDLYIPFYTHTTPPTEPGQSIFLRNTLAGFAEEAAARGVTIAGTPIELRPEGAPGVDLDEDGDLDFYVAHRLFLNDGAGNFTDAAAAYGLPVLLDEGVAFVDYDNDGLLDLYLRTSQVANQLFRNTGSAFVNVSTSSGLACLTQAISFFWGDTWADFDSDGDLDLLYMNNTGSGNYYLFLNDGAGHFGLGYAKNRFMHLAAAADFDLDGDLDVFRLGGIEENVLFRPANAFSLAVIPVDAEGRWNQQGTTIKVANECEPSPPIQTRVIGANNVYLAQGEYPAVFAVLADCTYEIEAAFLASGGLGRKVISVPYDPAVEGPLRIFVSRDEAGKEPYNDLTLKYYLPLAAR